MIRNFRPRVIVEIGTFLSVSTHWMAAALMENGQVPTEACIHCFDDFGPIHKGPWRDEEMLEGRLDWVRERLSHAGLLDYVNFYPGDSSTTVIKHHDLLRSLGGVDIAFIDGDHSVPGALADFHAVAPVLNTGGFIIVHDTFPDQCGGHQGPRYLLDNINTLGKGRYQAIDLYLSPLNFGLGLIRRID